jgi:PilZ domain-containing protein
MKKSHGHGQGAPDELPAHERRRFERVDVSFAAGVQVTDRKGKVMGVLRQLGRGGFMLEPEKAVKPGKKYEVLIVDKGEGIRRAVTAVARYADARYAGFEFQNLDVDAAVDIGILIGKYYTSELAEV